MPGGDAARFISRIIQHANDNDGLLVIAKSDRQWYLGYEWGEGEAFYDGENRLRDMTRDLAELLEEDEHDREPRDQDEPDRRGDSVRPS